jgi:multicomponent Na+:H+ antiporter subunit D
MNIHQSAMPVLIVVIPLLTAFVLPLVELWRRSLVFPLALAALVASFGSSILVAREVLTTGPVEYYMGGWEPPWGIAFRIDHLSALILLLLGSITLLVGIYSKRSILKELPEKEAPFYSVYLLLVAGLTGMVATADMFNLYVFLEISSLASYGLVSLGRGRAIVSAFRYVILGTVGAAFYLLGVGYLYAVTGSLNMADLALILPPLYDSNAVLVGFAFLVIGIAIKMALFPMHAWLPGAYSNAPSAVSALIAATTTKVAAYVLVRVIFFVFEPRFSIDTIPVTTLLSWMGAIAMLLGSVMAIAQSDLKRMLAYSSVAQIGYIVLGVGLANAMGFTGGILHLVNHAFMKGGLFLVAGAIVYRTGHREIKNFRFLSVRMPWTAATFTVCALAMIGIPPTGGFFSKLYLILGAIAAGQWVFVAVILSSSVLALTYLVNVIRYMYFPPPAAEASPEDTTAGTLIRDEAPVAMLAPMLILAVGIILLGLFNGEIVSLFIDPSIPERLLR